MYLKVAIYNVPVMYGCKIVQISKGGNYYIVR